MSRLTSLASAFCAALVFALCQAAALEIPVPLEPDFDQFGEQIYTVQTFTYNAQVYSDLGIYDTGASVMTFTAYNDGAIPSKVKDGAVGSGIGGDVVGDVSQPGAVAATGLQGILNPTFTMAVDPQLAVANVQVFIGTMAKSPDLPALTGMPIHKPSTAFPSGSAAHVSMLGQFNFGPELGDLVLTFPRLDMVATGASLTAKAGSTAPARIALTPYGDDNYGSEGDTITSAKNPTFNSVTLKNAAAAVVGQKMLFDTGAQVSIISKNTALALGLNLETPETVINVQGAAGTPITLPGFSISGIELAAAVDTAAADDLVKFSNVPVYVYDLGIAGLDGILGMNIFNTADEMLIDPVAGQLTVSFFENRLIEPGLDEGLLATLMGTNYSAFAGNIAPAIGLGPVTAVPEPSTAVLLVLAALAAFAWRRR